MNQSEDSSIHVMSDQGSAENPIVIEELDRIHINRLNQTLSEQFSRNETLSLWSDELAVLTLQMSSPRNAQEPLLDENDPH